jgi:D-sedoheptulose 7-phosphate isomerase
MTARLSSVGNPTTLCDHEHVASLHRALENFGGCVDTVDTWGTRLATLLQNGARLLAAGNGGSAAQAQHLTAELVGRYRCDRPPMSAICLSAETSSLTAICNDYDPDELFARQVEAHARPGDVLVLLSTSGRSPNLVAAARRGHQAGAAVWAITGPMPNPLADEADEYCCVAADYPATVQELHLVCVHVLCAAVDRALGLASPVTEAS